jgi:hypothetical protein
MVGESYGPFDPAYAQDSRELITVGSVWALGVLAGFSGVDAVSLLSTASVLSGGSLTPVGKLTAHLSDSRNAELVALRVSDPKSIVALAVDASTGRRLYVGNLTDHAIRCEVTGELHTHLALPARTVGVVQGNRAEFFE